MLWAELGYLIVVLCILACSGLGLKFDLISPGNVSNAGLARILKALDGEDLGKVTDAHLSAASAERFHTMRVVEKFILDNGEEFPLEHAEPALLISEMVASGEGVSSAYCNALERHGCTEWRTVVAFDEFSPGSKLKVDNRRKTMDCYVSFLELGQYVLADTAAWAIPLIVRHCMLVRIPGGWARVLRYFLDRLFFGPHGLATSGMALTLRGKSVVITAKLHSVLADGEGLKHAFDWKGSSGLKPCLLHPNVCMKGSDLVGRRPGFVEIDCFLPSEFKTWSQADVARTMRMLNEAARRVAANAMPKRRLAELSMVYGLNPNEHSLWTHPRLSDVCTTDLVGTITYDWVHSLLQDGSWAVEAWAFLQRCEGLGHTSADISAFLQDERWMWPQSTWSKGRSLWRVFDSYRSQSSDVAGKLKASASELLGLFALLLHFVHINIDDVEDLRPARRSFEAACHVLTVILVCKRGGMSPAAGADALLQAVQNHVRLHLEAYGNQHLRPKHHWMLHIGPQFLRDGIMLDCFIVERGHLLVKNIAEHVKNTSHYESYVMSGIVNALLKHSAVATLGSGLRGRIGSWHGLPIAGSMIVLGLQAAAGDIVFCGEAAGQILACVQEDEGLYAIVDELQLVEAGSRRR